MSCLEDIAAQADRFIAVAYDGIWLLVDTDGPNHRAVVRARVEDGSWARAAAAALSIHVGAFADFKELAR